MVAVQLVAVQVLCKQMQESLLDRSKQENQLQQELCSCELIS